MPDSHSDETRRDSGSPGEPETTRETPVGEDPTLVAGRYRIVRTLGRGGGGQVWLATDENLGRQVALKRVAGETDAEVLLNRGFREARTSATLAHQHVVRVYDAFEHEGSPWIVMEYVDGHSLAELIADGARLPVAQVASIGAQLATALAAAHGAGILHRDVKPANVLLAGESGRDAKLTDFGIARADEDPQLTRTGFVSGTAVYFSPELARGEDPSTASDVWALGATLYAAVEGERPFPERPNAVAQLHTIAGGQVRPPQHAGALEPVLAGMLDPDPRARWDAAHAARELDSVARGGDSDTAAAPRGGGHAAVAGGVASGAEAHTEQVPQADPTRTFARSRGSAQPPPAAPPPGASPAGARPAGGAPSRRSYAATDRPRRAAPRRGIWLGWLAAIPLLALLGWLVWTIATGSGTGLGGGDDASQDTGQVDTSPVGAAEAEQFVEDFYATLESEGYAAARESMSADAWLASDIAEGLGDVNVSEVQATESGDGTAQVSAVVSYAYGSVITQDETLGVARAEDGGLLIVSREAIPREGGTDDSGDDGDDQGDDDAASEDG